MSICQIRLMPMRDSLHSLIYEIGCPVRGFSWKSHFIAHDRLTSFYIDEDMRDFPSVGSDPGSIRDQGLIH